MLTARSRILNLTRKLCHKIKRKLQKHNPLHQALKILGEVKIPDRLKEELPVYTILFDAIDRGVSLVRNFVQSGQRMFFVHPKDDERLGESKDWQQSIG